MIKKRLVYFGILLFVGCSILSAQQTNLQIDLSKEVAEIQPTMYGIFFEDINFAADGGLYAELVKNRGFEFADPMMGWGQPNSDRHSLNLKSGFASIIKSDKNQANRNYCHVTVNDPSGYELINEGFRGMGIKSGNTYLLSINLANASDDMKSVNFQLVSDGVIIAECSVSPNNSDWETYEAHMTASQTTQKAKLKITFGGRGEIDMDMVSLFPEDTWNGRKKGLRKDLVQLLDDLQPGFLRFPGGCIVEGRTLARRYQWKKTVGPIEDRELLVNRWNTEFGHRLTPDYFQSFGLGFFEYFQLSEDMGAEPMPILSCGMACQFNTGELVPMEDLDPYVQDALDLIEFANGHVATPWGKIRAEMGHPKPFNLKYIGIGNEQWGPEYIKRYKVFEKTIKERYPDIVLISGSGPFPDGEHFEYGMEELVKLDAEIIDEHYYRPPGWFRENADRYDNYDRSGPKIFAGEYAAQSVAIASPDNKNNWNCALSEAAFMTGLERNADIVVMTSYAPLMAHADGWQWTPDLIWFNNLESYGTANYYVQKMFSNHSGTHLLNISSDGEALTGQDELYASSVIDKEKNEVYIKLVNTSDEKKEVRITSKGGDFEKEYDVLSLNGTGPDDVNSFGEPMAISPEEGSGKLKSGEIHEIVPPKSFVLYNLKKK